MTPRDILPESIDLKANLFALIITIFALIGLLLLQSKPIYEGKTSHSIVSEKEIEIMWDVQAVQKPESNSKKFIEANPDSPINSPDKTDNFSFQDQQAAQPTKSSLKNKLDLPSLEGVEFSSKVAPSFQETPNLKKLPEVQEFEKTQKDIQEIERKTIHTPKDPQVAKIETAEKEGLEFKKYEKEGSEKVINLSKKLTEENNEQEEKQIASLQPPKVNAISTKPRPRLSPELLKGPTMKTISSAPRIGAVAVECRLHPYGVYVQEMLRSIEDQWHQLANDSFSFLQRDRLKDKITYQFTLLADGTIIELKKLNKNDNFTLPGELCRQAIASRVPFGIWTPDMVDDFGQSDVITIHFNYR